MDDEVRRIIERAVGAIGPARWRDLGATGRAHAFALEASNARTFVKIGEAVRVADMLDCEADGLRAIRGTRTVRVPEVVATGRAGGCAFLALEWLEMTAGSGGAALGCALARLHAIPAPGDPHGGRFGWHRDNWIGGNAAAERLVQGLVWVFRAAPACAATCTGRRERIRKRAWR